MLFSAILAIAVLDRLSISLFGAHLSVYRLLSLPLLFIALLLLLRHGRLRWFGIRPTLLFLAGFLLAMGFSSFGAAQPEISFLYLLRYLEYTLVSILLYLIVRSQRSPRHWHSFCWWMLLSAFFSAMTVLSDFAGITAFYRLFEEARPFVRHVGILGEANYAGMKLATLVPFIFYLAASAARARHGLTLAFVSGAGLIVAFALFITGSRVAGLLAALAGIGFLLKEFHGLRQPRVMALFVLILGLFLSAAISFQPGPLAQAFDYLRNRYGLLLTFVRTGQEELGPVRETSLKERLDVLQTGLKIFRDHPVFGVGLSHFPLIIGQYNPSYSGVYSHNTYLSVLTELGLFGTIFFFSLIVRMLQLFVRASLSQPQESRFDFYLLLSYLVLLTGFTFLHELDNKYFWTLYVPAALYYEASEGRPKGSTQVA